MAAIDGQAEIDADFRDWREPLQIGYSETELVTDELLSNLVNQPPAPRGRLREYFEDRTISEMSIWFWIAAVSSFFLDIGCAVALSNWIESRGGSGKTAIALAGLILWLGFLAWLWISFVRIARGWGPERLGIFIFRYLRMGLIALTVAVGLPVSWDNLRDFSFVILAFDSVLVGMVTIFVPLAWCARCRIPWRGYREIFIIAVLFVLQMILWAHRSRT